MSEVSTEGEVEWEQFKFEGSLKLQASSYCNKINLNALYMEPPKVKKTNGGSIICNHPHTIRRRTQSQTDVHNCMVKRDTEHFQNNYNNNRLKEQKVEMQSDVKDRAW